MIRRFVPVVFALLAALAMAQPDPVGAWRGALGPGTLDLEIHVTFAADASGDGLTGTIDIPAQGLVAFALGEVVLDGAEISFIMPGVPGDPAFRGHRSRTPSRR